MVNLGIIKSVAEATGWVSSVAYSQKSHGPWCICLDPKDLNRALKRTHHHTPNLEEITHKLKGSSVFSKLDACHSYWSVVLDKGSSYLPTFNSPFGRFRFTRLPFRLCVSQDIFLTKDWLYPYCILAKALFDLKRCVITHVCVVFLQWRSIVRDWLLFMTTWGTLKRCKVALA